MAAPTTVEEAIEQNALGPASVTNADGQSVSAKDIDQLIEADKYLKAQTAAVQPHFGLRFSKLVPPGAG